MSDPLNLETKDFCDGALELWERAMSEVEFDRLLDAVRTAVAAAPEDFVVTSPKFFEQRLLRAANDNETAWGFIPFPEGWYAAC